MSQQSNKLQKVVNLQDPLEKANALKGEFMAQGRSVSYLRVSTARQGIRGLGLEAQRESVANYLNGGRWSLVKEVVEVESRQMSALNMMKGSLPVNLFLSSEIYGEQQRGREKGAILTAHRRT